MEFILVCGAGPEVENALNSIHKNGFDPVIVGIKGVFDGAQHKVSDFHELEAGDGQALIDLCSTHDLRKLVFAGSFSKLKMDEIHPDDYLKNFIGSKGSAPKNLEDWMRIALTFMNDNKLEIIPLSRITNSISHFEVGFATKRQWRLEDQNDFINARRLQRAVSNFWIGEVVVVRSGSILAVEAENEGTDDVLARIRSLKLAGEPNGIVVKWPFFDHHGDIVSSPVPTVGLRTFKLLKEANLSGAVLHRSTKVWNADQVRDYCDRHGIFIYSDSEDMRLR